MSFQVCPVCRGGANIIPCKVCAGVGFIQSLTKLSSLPIDSVSINNNKEIIVPTFNKEQARFVMALRLLDPGILLEEIEQKWNQQNNYMNKKMLTFGEAIELLKNGEKVARSGWNGRGMFIYLEKGSDPTTYSKDERVEAIRGDLFEQGAAGTATRLPNISMKNSQGNTVRGWLASQTDILAEDWNIVEI